MGTEEIIWNAIAVFLTICIFTFLYKDNPFYKFAEHLVVGVSAGYFAVILYYNGFVPKLIVPLRHGEWIYIIPAILGLMIWARFSRKWSWISRFSLAFYIGSGTGFAIALYMQNYVIRQLSSTMLPVGFTSWQLFSNILIIIGVLSALIYFFFSKEHTGLFGRTAKVGIWTLMIGFGAGFGLTVMGRVSLLAERVIFLREYLLELKYYLYLLFKHGLSL
ncbi:MAG: hypothetical protein OEV55_01310 [candidate division Zixibacteria bacterium]|nr:hypothetical protein [candidate division Zixibacteria bacterium]